MVRVQLRGIQMKGLRLCKLCQKVMIKSKCHSCDLPRCFSSNHGSTSVSESEEHLIR
jgi:hypothetical protein